MTIRIQDDGGLDREPSQRDKADAVCDEEIVIGKIRSPHASGRGRGKR